MVILTGAGSTSSMAGAGAGGGAAATGGATGAGAGAGAGGSGALTAASGAACSCSMRSLTDRNSSAPRTALRCGLLIRLLALVGAPAQPLPQRADLFGALRQRRIFRHSEAELDGVLMVDALGD